MRVVDRWMLTPKQLFACFVPAPEQKVKAVLAVAPFDIESRPLLGTTYTYRLALGKHSVAEDIVPVIKSRSGLKTCDDHRSGIVIIDGKKIIASYIINGQLTRSARHVVVHPDYRGKGLAKRMIEQWFREVPGVVDVPTQPITASAAGAFLSAHEQLCAWAVQNGKPVPAEVKAAVKDGIERQLIIARFAERKA